MFAQIVLCLILASFLFIGWTLGRRDFRKRHSQPLPLPPGPKPLPLLGNILDLPKAGEREWEHWYKHKKLYGPISSVTVLGTTMIILNDYNIAVELLDKRAGIYSSRPRMRFAGDLCGYDQFIAFRPYDKKLRLSRRHVHPILGTQVAASRFHALQEVEVGRFLLRVLERPEGFLKHARTEAGAIILKMAYGYSIEPHGADPLVDKAEQVLQHVTDATVAGAWLVDVVPALKYLPAWFPGAGFKRRAASWKKDFLELAEKPFEFVRQQMARGDFEPSFVSRLFERAQGQMDPEEEHVAKFDAVSLFAAGADTTVNTVQFFLLAMLKYPEIQSKAQAEIDAVVGTDRLATFEDRKNLPYVEAVAKESFRWRVVTPLGLPHVVTTDDEFGGWSIPKGAILMPNVWAYSHDSSVYQDPESFNPERFLGEKPELDPASYVFGFGRRSCSGRPLADSSVWLTIAKTLAALTICKAVNPDGEEIEPDIRAAPGLISHPYPFEATIRPRSSRHEALIREVERVHPWDKSNADELGAFTS